MLVLQYEGLVTEVANGLFGEVAGPTKQDICVLKIQFCFERLWPARACDQWLSRPPQCALESLSRKWVPVLAASVSMGVGSHFSYRLPLPRDTFWPFES